MDKWALWVALATLPGVLKMIDELIFYTIVKNQVEYDETLWTTRDAQREKRLEAKLKRQAKQLGYELVPIELKAA
jgi:hypothetical protein